LGLAPPWVGLAQTPLLGLSPPTLLGLASPPPALAPSLLAPPLLLVSGMTL